MAGPYGQRIRGVAELEDDKEDFGQGRETFVQEWARG